MATACAPPVAHTSSTPSSEQAASTVGFGQPSLSTWGGEATTRVDTPASWAGMTFISTLEG